MWFDPPCETKCCQGMQTTLHEGVGHMSGGIPSRGTFVCVCVCVCVCHIVGDSILIGIPPLYSPTDNVVLLL